MNRPIESTRRQDGGFAMIAFISLVALMSSYFIAEGLNRTNVAVQNARERNSMDALQQAKAALIAYAAGEQWQRYYSSATNFQPGALPCPDRDDDGGSEGLCSNALGRIGRLPWRTLGLADRRDASGERLWYALSADYRKLPYPAGGYTVINSDTEGQLTVTGASPASNVVAIVFAPGPAIQGQIRDLNPTSATHNRPGCYLEGSFNCSSDTGAYDTFASIALPSDSANDRMLIITKADIMAAVEPVVAAMIERDLTSALPTLAPLAQYHADWGAYPFPAAFSPGPGTSITRPQNSYSGNTTESSGLLPVTASASYSWSSDSVSVVSGNAVIGPPPLDCSTVSGNRLCVISFSHPVGSVGFHFQFLTLRLQTRVANVGTSIAVKPSAAAVVITGATAVSTSLAGSVLNTGSGVLTLDVTINDFYFCLAVNNCVSWPFFNPTAAFNVTLPAVTASTLTDPSNSATGWYIYNNWYRQTQYAVAPGYLPGGGATGNCSSNCLTVNNLASPANKTAVLVLAGRSLNGSPRPSSSLADYLEGENATPADRIFEHRFGAPTSTNDRVVVLAP